MIPDNIKHWPISISHEETVVRRYFKTRFNHYRLDETNGSELYLLYYLEPVFPVGTKEVMLIANRFELWPQAYYFTSREDAFQAAFAHEWDMFNG
jgi:hypothetical protein